MPLSSPHLHDSIPQTRAPSCPSRTREALVKGFTSIRVWLPVVDVQSLSPVMVPSLLSRRKFFLLTYLCLLPSHEISKRLGLLFLLASHEISKRLGLVLLETRGAGPRNWVELTRGRACWSSKMEGLARDPSRGQSSDCTLLI